MRAPRARARPNSSRTSTQAASPMTKPSRSASKGRQAWPGSSLRALMARASAKAPKQSGARGASTPPATAESARPAWMSRNASPTAIVPEAQLIPLVELGPVKPVPIAIWQLAAPAYALVTTRGSTLRRPERCSLAVCSSA